MKNPIPYLTQYYNQEAERKRNGVDISKFNEKQFSELRKLREKIMEQSGLTDNEISLILRCRMRNVFEEVNVYSMRIKI